MQRLTNAVFKADFDTDGAVPTRFSLVDVLDTLDSRLSDLHGALALLEKRLSIVVAPAKDCAKLRPDMPESRSALHDRLLNHIERTVDFAEQLRDLEQRVML